MTLYFPRHVELHSIDIGLPLKQPLYCRAMAFSWCYLERCSLSFLSINMIRVTILIRTNRRYPLCVSVPIFLCGGGSTYFRLHTHSVYWPVPILHPAHWFGINAALLLHYFNNIISFHSRPLPLVLYHLNDTVSLDRPLPHLKRISSLKPFNSGRLFAISCWFWFNVYPPRMPSKLDWCTETFCAAQKLAPKGFCLGMSFDMPFLKVQPEKSPIAERTLMRWRQIQIFAVLRTLRQRRY